MGSALVGVMSHKSEELEVEGLEVAAWVGAWVLWEDEDFVGACVGAWVGACVLCLEASVGACVGVLCLLPWPAITLPSKIAKITRTTILVFIVRGEI